MNYHASVCKSERERVRECEKEREKKRVCERERETEREREREMQQLRFSPSHCSRDKRCCVPKKKKTNTIQID